MVAHPDPFPVVAKAQLAQKVLTPGLMETVLARFEAGRHLLGVASSLGLGGGVAGGEGRVSGSNSWFDLGLTHPQAVLGVLLLSQPNLPLAAYLRSAFAAAVGVSRGLLASFAAAPVRMQLPTKVQDGVVECDGRGGRDWPRHGSLTAVGAGDGDGMRQQPLLLPALQARERECVAAALLAQGESLAAAGHRCGVFGRVRRVVGSVWRAVRLALVARARMRLKCVFECLVSFPFNPAPFLSERHPGYACVFYDNHWLVLMCAFVSSLLGGIHHYCRMVAPVRMLGSVGVGSWDMTPDSRFTATGCKTACVLSACT